MNCFICRRILLTMTDSSAGRHALDVSRTYHGSIPHAVLVLQCPLKDIGNDLHVAVSMHWEATTGAHEVLVDYAQIAETHVPRVVVLVERERVISVEPTMIEMATFF